MCRMIYLNSSKNIVYSDAAVQSFVHTVNRYKLNCTVYSVPKNYLGNPHDRALLFRLISWLILYYIFVTTIKLHRHTNIVSAHYYVLLPTTENKPLIYFDNLVAIPSWMYLKSELHTVSHRKRKVDV